MCTFCQTPVFILFDYLGSFSCAKFDLAQEKLLKNGKICPIINDVLDCYGKIKPSKEHLKQKAFDESRGR